MLKKPLHQRLYHWYATHGRHDLPWRNTHDPYRIYISEVMLQQTQVKTVLERFYFPFLTAFPTLKSLAEAQEQDVLKAWEGLGYYSRARNLHKAAKLCSPTLPDTLEGLMALPGIGRNTASAICAFAYHLPYPVMEANLRRVLSRFSGLATPSEKELWKQAEALLDRENIFDYNQAMMDIGAMVCTPKTPNCAACPLRMDCAGVAKPEHYGLKKASKKPPVRAYSVMVLEHEGKWLLTKRHTTFLHGLYTFLEIETVIPGDSFNATHKGQVSHQYSHFTAQAAVYHSPMDDISALPHHLLSGKEWCWVDKHDILAGTTSLPLSGIDQKMARLAGGVRCSTL